MTSVPFSQPSAPAHSPGAELGALGDAADAKVPRPVLFKLQPPPPPRRRVGGATEPPSPAAAFAAAAATLGTPPQTPTQPVTSEEAALRDAQKTLSRLGKSTRHSAQLNANFTSVWHLCYSFFIAYLTERDADLCALLQSDMFLHLRMFISQAEMLDFDLSPLFHSIFGTNVSLCVMLQPVEIQRIVSLASSSTTDVLRSRYFDVARAVCVVGHRALPVNQSVVLDELQNYPGIHLFKGSRMTPEVISFALREHPLVLCALVRLVAACAVGRNATNMSRCRSMIQDDDLRAICCLAPRALPAMMLRVAHDPSVHVGASTATPTHSDLASVIASEALVAWLDSARHVYNLKTAMLDVCRSAYLPVLSTAGNDFLRSRFQSTFYTVFLPEVVAMISSVSAELVSQQMEARYTAPASATLGSGSDDEEAAEANADRQQLFKLFRKGAPSVGVFRGVTNATARREWAAIICVFLKSAVMPFLEHYFTHFFRFDHDGTNSEHLVACTQTLEELSKFLDVVPRELDPDTQMPAATSLHAVITSCLQALSRFNFQGAIIDARTVGADSDSDYSDDFDTTTERRRTRLQPLRKGRSQQEVFGPRKKAPKLGAAVRSAVSRENTRDFDSSQKNLSTSLSAAVLKASASASKVSLDEEAFMEEATIAKLAQRRLVGVSCSAHISRPGCRPLVF